MGYQKNIFYGSRFEYEDEEHVAAVKSLKGLAVTATSVLLGLKDKMPTKNMVVPYLFFWNDFARQKNAPSVSRMILPHELWKKLTRAISSFS